MVEHPNAIHPEGTVRDRDEAIADYERGKRMLSDQSFDLEELLVSGERVAVRARWRGTVAGGASLEAKIAAFLTVARRPDPRLDRDRLDDSLRRRWA